MLSQLIYSQITHIGTTPAVRKGYHAMVLTPGGVLWEFLVGVTRWQTDKHTLIYGKFFENYTPFSTEDIFEIYPYLRNR